MRALLALIILFTSISLHAAFKSVGKKSKQSKSITKVLQNKAVKSFSLFNSGITMPTKPINGRLHGGVELGYKAALLKKNKHLLIGTDFGFFYQKGMQSAFYIKPAVSYNFNATNKLSFEPKLGAGLLVSSKYNKEFKLNTDGTYSQVNRLVPQFVGSFGVQSNYEVFKNKNLKCNVFVKYEFAAQLPFSSISSLLPLTLMHLGFSVQGK
jgi:hypothetical protein